ncbi:LRR repeats and ubiquitin-like domain-containing protein At2g30105 [Andrographis paniculata]|uniref:LRR repeats and ubiquitin-like domain-containing protein At2g30105 n=1 Tax=Andrographis paniculata TaxID=175694 RepID=UPI0021E73C37|nr:LRR repeats and ubiquitin-like domain-containing protein At2g30105 [Andrographis paniculata]
MDLQPAQEQDGGGASKFNLTVKFSGRSIPIEIGATSTVKDVKALLQTLTNVLPRGQKLIYKGRVLSDDLTLESSGVINGSKIMLMASQGLHQGDGPIKKDSVAITSVRKAADNARGKKEKIEVPVTKSRLERWKATGVIALSNSGLTNIPEEILTSGTSARVLDVSQNSLLEVPATVACLSSMQKLFLNGNNLSDKSISWEGVTSLKSLMVLSLNENNLTTLPSSIGALTCLKQLNISGNKLSCMPAEIGLLTELQVLKADNNRLQSIPVSIGGCFSLIEVDLSHNLLAELPETFDSFKNLKALYLKHNGLKSLPSTLFKSCLQLSILDLHGTEITMDVLRQFEGWESFDERRRSKHQKQLEFRVAGAGEFDEGADKNW